MGRRKRRFALYFGGGWGEFLFVFVRRRKRLLSAATKKGELIPGPHEGKAQNSLRREKPSRI